MLRGERDGLPWQSFALCRILFRNNPRLLPARIGAFSSKNLDHKISPGRFGAFVFCFAVTRRRIRPIFQREIRANVFYSLPGFNGEDEAIESRVCALLMPMFDPFYVGLLSLFVLFWVQGRCCFRGIM